MKTRADRVPGGFGVASFILLTAQRKIEPYNMALMRKPAEGKPAAIRWQQTGDAGRHGSTYWGPSRLELRSRLRIEVPARRELSLL